MTSNKTRYAILKVIDPRVNKDTEIASYWETESLVKTLSGEIVCKDIQHRDRPHPATYIGPGKVEELIRVVKDYMIDVVVLDDLVNTSQLFRLEKMLWEVNTEIKVWDRADLILEVFYQHATSSEAKLQIELAQIKNLGPRIFGLGGTLLSRQSGGIGLKGKGETNTEIMKRHIKKRVAELENKLEKINLHRHEEINRRKEKGIKTVALVGYTNSGKTSLFNALTGKNKIIKNAVFTTLDSCVGKINDSTIVSDTIGFIENLPPFLIHAFKSTLMESIYSDIVFHIIDASDKSYQEKIIIVEDILEELGIYKEKIYRIYNKIDLLDENNKIILDKIKDSRNFLISVITSEGLENLKNKLLFLL